MQVKKDIIAVMNVESNLDLRLFSTMRLGGRARHVAKIKNKDDIFEAEKFARENNLKIIVIGSGSNIIWKDSGFNGLLLINEIPGIDIEDLHDHKILKVGAGVNWDEFVEKTVQMNLSGVEALSLIPGKVGATLIQNVGAYGQEVSQTIVTIEAYDTKTNQYVNIKNEDCGFGYRTSRFKTEDKNRYIITEITFKLQKDFPNLPLYPAVENYFLDNNILVTDPKTIRFAVINIRKNKLPDPSEVANNGSFFANPIITSEHFQSLQNKFQNISYWETGDGHYKISAAWLIEHAGFKNYKDDETGMSTWPSQPLVLVNESAKSTQDLLKFKQKITSKILEMFEINLEQEPELLP